MGRVKEEFAPQTDEAWERFLRLDRIPERDTSPRANLDGTTTFRPLAFRKAVGSDSWKGEGPPSSIHYFMHEYCHFSMLLTGETHVSNPADVQLSWHRHADKWSLSISNHPLGHDYTHTEITPHQAALILSSAKGPGPEDAYIEGIEDLLLMANRIGLISAMQAHLKTLHGWKVSTAIYQLLGECKNNFGVSEWDFHRMAWCARSVRELIARSNEKAVQ